MAIKYDLATPISNAFIDRYMTAPNPLFVLVYIMGLRLCLYGKPMSMSALASELNILESDVRNAWNYWEKEGLVSIRNEESGQMIDFLAIPNTDNKPVPLKVVDPAPSEIKPQYTTEELELYKNGSLNIERLFKAGEKALGKLLNYGDLNTLFSIYDWLKIPLDVIFVLLEYCAENGHRNIRYIEKMAVDWADNEIDTVEKAEAHINLYNNEYREILRAFGHTRREPTASEIKYMKKWRNEYKMSLELITTACDKTVIQIGQPQFSYADKILQNWMLKGIKTLEEAEAESAKTEIVKPVRVKETVKKNRFVNFKQRDVDYEQLEKQEQAYLQRIIQS